MSLVRRHSRNHAHSKIGRLHSEQARELKLWRFVFILSLIAGAAVLSHPLRNRPTDGDDAEHFYRAGLTPWSKILSSTLLPAEPRPFVMQRARPATFNLAPKVFWSLGLSNTQYHLLIWIFGALSILAFAWSICLALRVGGLAMHPASPWILATLVWWSAPSLMYLSLGAVNTWIYALCHLTVAMLCLPEPKYQKLRLALSVPFSLLAFQSYEGNWFFFLWLGLWLLSSNKFSLREKKALKFAWPLLLMLAFILFYRSLIPDQKILSNQNPDGFVLSLDPGILINNAYYYLLVFFNGMSLPMTGLLNRIDTTPATLPLAFLMSVGGFVLAGWHFKNDYVATRSTGKAANRTRKILIAAFCSLIVILGAAAPHWTISNHRFIYFPMVPMFFVMVCFSLVAISPKKVRALPILLVVAGNALGAFQALTQPNWNDVNSNIAVQFYNQAMAREAFRACSPAAPCCVKLNARYWGHNEWILNWLAGGNPSPSYLPEDWKPPQGWSAPVCASHIRFD